MPKAGEAWSRFLADKIQRGSALVQALVKEDGSDGALKGLALKVCSMADYTRRSQSQTTPSRASTARTSSRSSPLNGHRR